MLATIASAALHGIDAEPVYVEVNADEIGESRLFLVGLPDTAGKESGDRVWAALNNTGFRPRLRSHPQGRAHGCRSC